ncbi:unnamed protein product [Caenorhabditis angaria]|uniref:F-box domain-containing protein n=1 Tax=Caenorhabditis angaria TaxID=860376 RepID=A0A9P1I818_9PELO|nr:unnamed protein product [Caenorhabditis angaria]
MEVHSKMKGWNDLPFEMKCEVFKYLEQKDRFKFAKCSLRCLNEVLHEEKDIRKVELARIKSAGEKLFILTIDGNMKLNFKQVGKLCKIQCEDEIIWKGVENGKTMVYEFFENILAKHKNHLYRLYLSKVDFMIRDKSIDNFPKLKFFKITTNNEKQLYSFLSKIENVYDLTVNFRDFGNTENSDKIRFPENFKFSQIDVLKLVSNNANVALNIIDKIDMQENKCFGFASVSIIDGKLAEVDDKLMKFFKKCGTLKTNLVLTNDQFMELTNSVHELSCDAANINPHIIVSVLEKRTMHFIELDNVHSGILEYKKRLELVPKKEIWGEIVPNEYIFDWPSIYGTYDSYTGRLSIKHMMFDESNMWPGLSSLLL